MPTKMQIRTRRRRGRKISRRRPQRQSRMSRRQSLSRRRLKSHSGGKQPVGFQHPPSIVTVEHNTETTEEIGPDIIALARELLDNTEIKNYLNNVEKMMIAKLGGENKLDDAILAAAEAAAAKHQAGGALDGEGGEEETDSQYQDQDPSSEEVPSPETVFTRITSIITRIIRMTRINIPQGINMIILVGLIFMMFMIDGAEARRRGRPNTIRSSTPAIENMFNPYDPSRPGQIWSFWNALFALFGYGPGAWGPDPQYHWAGPHRS